VRPVKRWILVFVALTALASGAPCLELTGGVRAGAGGSLFYGGWVEIPVLDFLSIRVEPILGPVGGALLASDGCDVLVGVTAIELAVPVLAVTRIGMPVGEIVLGAGVFVGGALSVRQIQNDGAIRSEGDLASVLSITSPWRDRMLNTVSIELTAGWEFNQRGTR
jgi:hypothetical protein